MVSTDTRTRQRALIIGCGIAGPVLAMFLQRAGIEAVVYEGRPKPGDEAGAFLNLAPGGLAVLDALGIREDIEAYGTPTTSMVFQNYGGRRLGEMPQTSTLFKRGLLCKGLREAAMRRGGAIEFGKRLKDVETTTGRAVIARFEDGSEESGDLLVGCDGINSRTRRLVMPDAPEPVYTGVIGCGAFTRCASAPPSGGLMRMTFGKEGFFGYQVAPSGEVYWFQNLTQPTEPDQKELDAIPNGEWRAVLLEKHHGNHAPIAGIICSTEFWIGRWPIYDIPSLPTWHKGPVVLIGDAAHATSPHTGQGASLAMEDALVLARCLRDIPDVEEAFAAYEALRKDRVEEAVERARRIGKQKVPSNTVTRGLRDLVLPFFLKQGAKYVEQGDSYRVDWGETVDITGHCWSDEAKTKGATTNDAAHEKR